MYMKIGILTSGGDAPGMNPLIRAVVRSGIYYNHKVYGIENGFEGLIDGKVRELNESSVADIIQRGGTFLGTSRSERFTTEEGLKKAVNVLEIFNIDYLIVCGGDGSLRGALRLKKFEELTGIDTKVTIPGYIQRGGSPCVFDRILASQMGLRAIEEINKKNEGLAIGYQKEKIISLAIEEIFDKKKEFSYDLLRMLKIISI